MQKSFCVYQSNSSIQKVDSTTFLGITNEPQSQNIQKFTTVVLCIVHYEMIHSLTIAFSHITPIHWCNTPLILIRLSPVRIPPHPSSAFHTRNAALFGALIRQILFQGKLPAPPPLDPLKASCGCPPTSQTFRALTTRDVGIQGVKHRVNWFMHKYNIPLLYLSKKYIYSTVIE